MSIILLFSFPMFAIISQPLTSATPICASISLSSFQKLIMYHIFSIFYHSSNYFFLATYISSFQKKKFIQKTHPWLEQNPLEERPDQIQTSNTVSTHITSPLPRPISPESSSLEETFYK